MKRPRKRGVGIRIGAFEVVGGQGFEYFCCLTKRRYEDNMSSTVTWRGDVPLSNLATSVATDQTSGSGAARKSTLCAGIYWFMSSLSNQPNASSAWNVISSIRQTIKPRFPSHGPHSCWPGEYPLVQADSDRIHGVDFAIEGGFEVSMCAQTLLDEALPASLGP